MTRVYLADARPEQRSMLCLLVLSLRMELVGQALDWPTTLAQGPLARPDLLVVEWGLLPVPSRPALTELRRGCPGAIKVILLSRSDARHQAAISAGADAYIGRAELPERVAEHLRVAAHSLRSAEIQSRLRLYNLHPGA